MSGQVGGYEPCVRGLLRFSSSSRAGLSGCGYNTMQQQDERRKAAWSEVLNQYQRRADLIPNLVATRSRDSPCRSSRCSSA